MKSPSLFKLALISLLLLPSWAFGLVMRENGPEPIVVQIKQSLRLSDDLDQRLNEFSTLRQLNGLTVEKWWAGRKFLALISFPPNATEKQALSVIAKLQRSNAVEKVVALSASSLEFTTGDFAREYTAAVSIPDAARRGLDADRIGQPSPSAPDDATLLQLPHVPNQLIVGWKEEYMWKAEATGFKQKMAKLHSQAGCRVLEEHQFSPTKSYQVLEFDDPAALGQKLREYINSGFVAYAQPNYLYQTHDALPNDPAYANAPGPQWNLSNISAPQAWDLTTGDQTLATIAVGDSGANVNHPDFVTSLWSGQNNSDRKNWATTSPASFTDVHDDNGHGSNVAAILGATGNNGAYVTGVAWNVGLMILKVVNFAGYGTSSQVASGINYAWGHQASAINLSLGVRTTICQSEGGGTYYCYGGSDPLMLAAVRSARDHNMDVVCSAGNDRLKTNLDGTPQGDNDDNANSVGPTNFPTDNIISVLATDRNDYPASYSSYGSSRVDLAAPGGELNDPIIGLKQTFNGDSSDPANYSFEAGTSMAAPQVSGALALIKSRFPWEDYSGLRDRLLMGTDRTGTLEDLCRTNGRLNVNKTLQTRSMLRNLSTRARVEGGDRKMIGGFVIGSASPTGTLTVAIVARGPTLAGLTVPLLNNPMITLNDSAGVPIRVQYDSGPNDYLSPTERTQLQGFGLLPADSREPAMVMDLAPGAYTVSVDSQDGQYGVGTFEIYEAEGNTDERARLRNLSTRCIVGTGEEQPIAGMIIRDSSDSNPLFPDRRVLILGKGPSLNVTGKLANPVLQVLSTGETNDNWTTLPVGMVEELSEAHVAPTNTLESALWPTFRPGIYTVSLGGVSQTTGLGSLEIYEY